MNNLQLSKRKATYLFDHILRGFDGSLQSIKLAYEKKLITQEEYSDLLERNSARLVKRINEFVLEFTKRTVCVFFAMLFGYLQVSGEDLEVRRPGRTTRSARSVRSARGKRKDDKTDGPEDLADLPDFTDFLTNDDQTA